MKSGSLVVWMAFAASILPWKNPAQAQFTELVGRVPETANALVLVEAKKAFTSPMALREGWRANRQQRFAAGLTSIPPTAKKLVIAAYVDVEVADVDWEIAVTELESPISLRTLATQFRGAPDTLRSLPALRLPDDSYVVQFSPVMYGAMSPGNRQQVSRWISRPTSSLSPYLQEGISYAESGTEVLMILDLHNAFAAEDVKRELERYETLKSFQVDQAELAKVVASIEGVMLGITFGERAFGKLKVDFGQDASLLSKMAKPLILEIVGAYGMMIDEAADWKAEVKGKQVFLGGPLTYDGLTRLATLVDLPTSALHTQLPVSQDQTTAQQTTGQTTGQDSAQKELNATKQYFESVEHLLDNLRSRKSDIRTMGQVAQWFENYARKVDRLPLLNVDEEMLEHGAHISEQLDNASMVLRGTTIRRRVDQVAAGQAAEGFGGGMGGFGMMGGMPGGGFGGFGAGGMGGFGMPGAIHHADLKATQRARTQVRVQAKAQGAVSVQEIIRDIQSARAEIRRAMTKKYQVEF